MYIHFIQTFIYRWTLGHILLLAIVNNPMNVRIVNNAMSVSVPVQVPAFNSLGNIPRSGIYGSSDNSVF